MATYKLIQDIEAEDKILGPLTLKQFIYALIAAFFLYISFLCWRSGVLFLLIIFLPPALMATFFAFPFGKDQPTEVWALAKIRFLVKPRKRIWDQSGVKELVTITVPKKVERVLTNGLSQNEVHSRLKTLASTIDTRGWAIKNVNVNLYSQTNPVANRTSDRLIDVNNIPQQVPDIDVNASDDILDAKNNPIAQQFDHMITTSAQAHRQQLIDELNSLQPASSGLGARPASQSSPTTVPNDYWFLHQPSQTELPPAQTMFPSVPIVAPGAVPIDNIPIPTAGTETPDEVALAAQFKNRKPTQEISYAHLRTLQPLSSAPPVTPADTTVIAKDQEKTADAKPAAPSTPQYDPAILSLANNNDLNVATLAREAYKAKNPDESSDEVVISLH